LKWVVEVKAGAPLERIQNPTKPEFEKKGVGYGWLFSKAEAKSHAKMRYIVLGANDPLKIPVGHKPLGICVQQRRWADLLKGIERKGIVKDLIDTFAELQIGEFYMEKAREIVVTDGIQDAVNAWIVLDTIGKCLLGVPERKRRLEAYRSEDGWEYFGYYVEQPRRGEKSKPYLNLRRATTKRVDLAWFGYEYNSDGKEGNKAVWFYYLDDEEKRDFMTRKLTSKRFSAAPERDDGGRGYCVHVTSPLKHSGKDLEWFQKVIDYAIKK
jgi:hypothetical protein